MKRLCHEVFFLAFALVCLACRSENTAIAPPPPPEVAVADVIQRDVTLYSDWVGTTQGFVNASIYPKISGYLIKQNYRDGDAVQIGQLLFQIDPRQYQAALDQAIGNLAQAHAWLKENQQNLGRYTELYRQGVIPKQDFQNQTQNTRATAAQVQADEAAVATAKLNLEWTRIVCPINGVAGIAKAQVGDLVSPTTLLTTVSQVNPIKVEFPLSERTYLEFAQRINQDPDKRQQHAPKLEIILANGTTYKFTGEIYDVNRQVDIQTGTIKIQAIFPNPGNILRPGLYAKVRAATGVLHDALLVPQPAVIETQGQYQVVVVDANNRVAFQNVEIGKQSQGFRIIRQGLSAGQRVVVQGVQKVHDGMIVKPRTVSAQAAAEAGSTNSATSSQTSE